MVLPRRPAGTGDASEQELLPWSPGTASSGSRPSSERLLAQKGAPCGPSAASSARTLTTGVGTLARRAAEERSKMWCPNTEHRTPARSQERVLARSRARGQGLSGEEVTAGKSPLSANTGQGVHSRVFADGMSVATKRTPHSPCSDVKSTVRLGLHAVRPQGVDRRDLRRQGVRVLHRLEGVVGGQCGGGSFSMQTRGIPSTRSPSSFGRSASQSRRCCASTTPTSSSRCAWASVWSFAPHLTVAPRRRARRCGRAAPAAATSPAPA